MRLFHPLRNIQVHMGVQCLCCEKEIKFTLVAYTFASLSGWLICILHMFLLVVVYIKIVNLTSCLILPYSNDKISYNTVYKHTTKRTLS